MSKSKCAVAFLWAWLLVGTAQPSAAAVADAPSYPPAGSPEPAAPCARKDTSAVMDFFCRFLTQERWLQAGRPEYIDAGGKRWQAWFYGRDGLTNQLLVEGKDYLPEREGWFEALFDVGNFEAQTYSYFWDLFRYAPWSVQFLYAGDCTGTQALNPAALASARFRRMHILGFGWQEFAADPADPGRAFAPAALPLLLTLADLQYAPEPSLQTGLAEAGALRAEVNALAAGQGRLWPDYARDGGVWLIERDGTATAVDDLDAAAMRFVATGLMVTNDAMHTWDSGYRVAAEVARTRGPLLYMYFAQDPFLPVDPDGVYSRRLHYLLDQAAGRSGDKAPALRIISHGRSASVIARAVADHPALVHQSYAPAVSPLDAGDYAQALQQAVASKRIDITTPALPMTGGASSDICLDPVR